MKLRIKVACSQMLQNKLGEGVLHKCADPIKKLHLICQQREKGSASFIHVVTLQVQQHMETKQDCWLCNLHYSTLIFTSWITQQCLHEQSTCKTKTMMWPAKLSAMCMKQQGNIVPNLFKSCMKWLCGCCVGTDTVPILAVEKCVASLSKKPKINQSNERDKIFFSH